jgi:putative transposase
MDEKYLLACTRYVKLNPVRTGLAKNPEDWKWSSASSHIKAGDDIIQKT